MRNFILVLVLLNFLAFAYQRWILEPDQKVDALYVEQDYPGLAVVEQTPVAAEAAALLVVPAASAADRCLRIGPFPREADADNVRGALEARNAEVRRTSEEGSVWVGHWVQVADSGSRAAAEQVRDALKVAGMGDAYVLPSDDDFRVSLGVFRLRSSANRVLEKATQLGYETRVDDRFQPGSNFWLSVRMPPGVSLQPGEFQTDAGQILRTEPLGCAKAGF